MTAYCQICLNEKVFYLPYDKFDKNKKYFRYGKKWINNIFLNTRDAIILTRSFGLLKKR